METSIVTVYLTLCKEYKMKLNGKAVEVNKFLSKKCSFQNIPFIDNSNIDERCHLNGSDLHLNYGGTCILANNFLNCIGF